MFFRITVWMYASGGVLGLRVGFAAICLHPLFSAFIYSLLSYFSNDNSTKI